MPETFEVAAEVVMEIEIDERKDTQEEVDKQLKAAVMTKLNGKVIEVSDVSLL